VVGQCIALALPTLADLTAVIAVHDVRVIGVDHAPCRTWPVVAVALSDMKGIMCKVGKWRGALPLRCMRRIATYAAEGESVASGTCAVTVTPVPGAAATVTEPPANSAHTCMVPSP
jgi:hypothetical protein